MSQPTEPKVEATSSRVRPRSPEPFGRNVGQRTDPPVPSVGRAERDAVMKQAANNAIIQEESATAIKLEQDVFGDHVWRMDHNFDTALTHILLDNAEHPMLNLVKQGRCSEGLIVNCYGKGLIVSCRRRRAFIYFTIVLGLVFAL